MCRTWWISRIDGLDVFEELFTYVVETLEYFSVNPESTINRDTSIKAQALLTHILNFNFIVSLVITRKVFDFTHSVTALLQAKSNDIINGFELIGSLIDLMSNIRINIDKYHDEWYSEACKLAQKTNVNESVEKCFCWITISLLKAILINSIDWYCFKWIEKEIWRKPEMHFWRFVYNSIFYEWLIKKPY